MTQRKNALKIFSESVADRFMYRLARSLNKRKYRFGFKNKEGFVYDLDSDIVIIDDGRGGTLFKGFMKRTNDDRLLVNFNGRVFYPSSYYILEDFLSYSRANNLFDYSSGEEQSPVGGDVGFSDFGPGSSGGGGMDFGGGSSSGGLDLGGGSSSGGLDLGGGDMGGGADASTLDLGGDASGLQMNADAHETTSDDKIDQTK